MTTLSLILWTIFNNKQKSKIIILLYLLKLHGANELLGIMSPFIDSSHYSRSLVLPNSSFEEIRFSLQWDKFHPLERILCLIDFRIAKHKDQSIGYKLNILAHKIWVHSNKLHWKGISNEMLFNFNCVLYNGMNSILWQLIL